MRNLCIGIIDLSPGWKSILDQIGVWYQQIEDFDDLLASYSVIIVNKPISPDQEELLHAFNDNGGSVLETPDGDTFSHARFTVAKKVKTLINDYSIPFLEHIPFLDIHNEAHLYNGQDNFSGLIDFERIQKGIVCNLGVNPDELIADNSYTRKRFYFKDEKHPDELTSKVSKGALVDLICSLLKELHFQQGLPFINKWTSPKEKPVFAFRIDSDFGDQKSIRDLYSIAREYSIPMTWFLHVKAHEEWLSIFHEFEGHEIALHGYEHGTSDSYEHIFNNIETGFQLLVDAGFKPKGFCVPYGIWNDTLAEVLQKFEFSYTSEFTVGYDALPFKPIHKGSGSLPLQVPIHPICTGSLNRKKTSLQEMKEYFMGLIDIKTSSYQNTVFYHHPLQPGTEVWKEIFAKVNELDLTKLTFQEYASFWEQRAKTSYSAAINLESGELSFSGGLEGMLIQVSKSHSSFELIRQTSEQQISSSGNFNYHHPAKKISEKDINLLKSNKLQLLKTSLLDWKNRIRL